MRAPPWGRLLSKHSALIFGDICDFRQESHFFASDFGTCGSDRTRRYLNLELSTPRRSRSLTPILTMFASDEKVVPTRGGFHAMPNFPP